MEIYLSDSRGGSIAGYRGFSLGGYSFGYIFGGPHTLLHEPFGHVQVVSINDVVAALHGVCFVTRDLHADHLWDSGAAHVAYGGSAEVMESASLVLQLRRTRSSRIHGSL